MAGKYNPERTKTFGVLLEEAEAKGAQALSPEELDLFAYLENDGRVMEAETMCFFLDHQAAGRVQELKDELDALMAREAEDYNTEQLTARESMKLALLGDTGFWPYPDRPAPAEDRFDSITDEAEEDDEDEAEADPAVDDAAWQQLVKQHTEFRRSEAEKDAEAEFPLATADDLRDRLSEVAEAKLDELEEAFRLVWISRIEVDLAGVPPHRMAAIDDKVREEMSQRYQSAMEDMDRELWFKERVGVEHAAAALQEMRIFKGDGDSPATVLDCTEWDAFRARRFLRSLPKHDHKRFFHEINRLTYAAALVDPEADAGFRRGRADETD